MSVSLDKILATMTEQVYKKLLVASETGKWSDGSPVGAQQREYCLQLILLWQARHNSEPQHMTLARGGELSINSKQELRQQLADQAVVARFTLD